MKKREKSIIAKNKNNPKQLNMQNQQVQNFTNNQQLFQQFYTLPKHKVEFINY